MLLIPRPDRLPLLLLVVLLGFAQAVLAGPVEDARGLLGKGKVAEAQSMLEAHLSQVPGDRNSGFLLANIYARSGNMTASYRLFEALLAQNADDPVGREVASLFAERGASAADAERVGALFGQVQKAMQAGRRGPAMAALAEVLKLAPHSLPALHNLSQMLEQARRFEQAVPYVETLARLHPGDVTIKLRLAGLYERLGKNDQAGDLYRAVIKRQPNNVVALFSLGRLSLFSDKDYATAADYLAQVLKVDGKRADVAYLLGVAYREGGDRDAAMAAFQRSVALDDHFFQAHFEIALALEKSGNDEAAMARFAKVAKFGGASPQAEQSRRRLSLFGGDAKVAVKVKKAINTGIKQLAEGDLAAAKAAFLEVIALVPSNTLARYNLATVYTREGSDDLAVEELTKALEGDESHYLSHYGLALIHVGAGRFEEAFDAYKKVIEWSPPDSPYAVEARSRVTTMEKILAEYTTKLGARKAFLNGNKMSKAGDFEGAVVAYEEAIAQDDQNPFYHYNAGIAYVELGRLADSFKAFRAALTLKPDHVQSHFRLGLFFLATGFPQQAVTSFDNVIRYGQDGSAEVEEAKNRRLQARQDADKKEKQLAYLVIANALGVDYGNEEGALSALEKAYTLNPSAKEVVSRYAELLMQMRREEKARELLEPVLEARPDDFRTLWNLGQIYKTQLEWDLAESTLIKALEVKPDFSRAITMLAEVQERTGNIDAAVDTLKDHLEKNPEDRGGLIGLVQMLMRRDRDADAAGLIDWYLANHKEFAEVLYMRGLLAGRLGGIDKAQQIVQTDSNRQSIIADEADEVGGASARYDTPNGWYNRVIEIGDAAEPKDAKWVNLSKQKLAASKRLSMAFSQTVFDFNTNANNSATDPQAGVSSQVQFSVTYTTLRTARFSLPVTLSTRHQFHYAFQTYVGTNSLSATLPSRLPLITVTPNATYSLVRTQAGTVSSTTSAGSSVRWRPAFPSTLNGSYQYTEFISKTNAGNSYTQDRISAIAGHHINLGKRLRVDGSAAYTRSVRDVVAAFRDTEQNQLRYEGAIQLTLPRRSVVRLRGWQTTREDLRGTNRRGDVSPIPPAIPIDALEVGGELNWWFQLYPKVRGRGFGSFTSTQLSNVVQNQVLPDGSPSSSLASQTDRSTAFGLEFTYRPDPGVSWVLSLRQDERKASVELPVNLEDQLTGQVVQDNINKQQTIRLQMNYAF